jgi:putative flippase GtrA
MMLRYGAAGLFGLAVNIVIVATSIEIFHLPPSAAAAAGFATVFLLGFLLARHAVFNSGPQNLWHQIGRFSVINGVMRLGEFGLFLLLLAAIGLHYVLTLIIVLSMSNIVKFILYRNLVFPRKKERNQ